MKKWVGKLYLWLLGYEIIGKMPKKEKKYLIIVAPHTSNWDFPLGLAVRWAKGFRSWFVAKKSLFIFPFGYFFKALDGIPVDRKNPGKFVEEIVKEYQSRTEFVLTFAPEGTRKKVKNFKTGFYYVALKAKIPIQPIKFDLVNKKVTILDLIYPTGDYKKEIAEIEQLMLNTSNDQSINQ